MEDQQLEKLKQLRQLRQLRQCIVRIHPNGGGLGTGFFVASGLILTCNHVGETKTSNPSKIYWKEPIKIYWKEKDQGYPAEIWNFSATFDLAILKLTSEVEHPCVTFDRTEPGIDTLLYSFGYSMSNNVLKGDSVTCNYEGSNDVTTLYKLKNGQFERGFSGSPLVNLTTGKVCGIVKTSRNIITDLGGRAIPAEDILKAFPNLEGLDFQSHEKNVNIDSKKNSKIIEDDYDHEHRLEEYYDKAAEYITDSFERNQKQEIDVICRNLLEKRRKNLKLTLKDTTKINDEIIKDCHDLIRNSKLSYLEHQRSIKTLNKFTFDDDQRSKLIKQYEEETKVNQEESGYNFTIEGSRELEAGNIEVAINNFKEAINKNVEDDAAYAGLGASLYKLGKLKEAITSLKEARKLREAKAMELKKAGKLCEAEGMEQRARKHDDFIQSINIENNFFNKVINIFRNF